MKKYSKETKILEEELFSPEDTEKVAKPILVCRPTLRNITLFFVLLKDFVLEIEQSLNLCSDDHCPLHAYLCDCTSMFLDHVNSDINKMLKSAAANLDAWNTVPIGDGASSEKEVLSCSLILENILRELQDLMKCLPDYSTHFFQLVYYVIHDYKDIYLKAFKQMFEEDLNILSVSWARDRDIKRLMKSFLNWRHLEDEEATDVVESPEEVRVRNKEESELLIRNLRAEDETPWEVIVDSSKLSNLALLQENLMWFSVALLRFIKDFGQSPSPSSCPGENSVSGAVSKLRKIIKEYEDFADTCLLALHLEVRARCFHYLQPFARREVCSADDIESAVKCLTGDLLQIDEVLLPILTPKEFKYVFEGVGELVASLMILVVSSMSRASEGVVRAVDRGLFVVQCCLGSITMARESSLERARGFIELLGSSPEEILDQVVEEGPRFAEWEYASVLRLVSSEPAPGELERHLEKLRMIFKSLASRANEAS